MLDTTGLTRPEQVGFWACDDNNCLSKQFIQVSIKVLTCDFQRDGRRAQGLRGVILEGAIYLCLIQNTVPFMSCRRSKSTQ